MDGGNGGILYAPRCLLRARRDPGRNHSDAMDDLQRALALFRQNHDSDSQAYYLTEIAYAHAMSSAGSKNEASNIESDAKASLSRLREHPCASCTISAQSFQ